VNAARAAWVAGPDTEITLIGGDRRLVDPVVADLRRARLAKGIRAVDLAVYLGVSAAAVTMWETGARMPSLSTARRWADALGLALAISAQPASRPE
jgi:ribosome-binding protein aMBF1 (putative translation factor)